MHRWNKFGVTAVLVMGCVMSGVDIASARGGRGGARPSMGRVGGGGGRPSMGRAGGSGGRPSMGMAGGRAPARMPSARPSVQRPSMGHVSRPTPSRPQIATRPAGGGFSPSGGRPGISRPSTRPGGASRPSTRPPQNVRPVTRPSLPSGGFVGGNRPTPGVRPATGNRPAPGVRPGVDRPGLGHRPGVGGDRPSLGNVNRPITLPARPEGPGLGGNRPGGGVNRPGTGGNRPGGGIGDRPVIGGNRPGIGGNRPGTGVDRPGIANRPGIGDRPIIGGNRPGRPNRPGIGGGNINIGNDINIGGGNIIGNRPGWDRPDWNRPDWGWGGGWAGNWHNHCIHHHHGWYNGCWNRYWSSNWYAPLAWGAVGWGLGAVTSGWGYGTAYYNPYYVQPVAAATVPYDYSQPVVVNNYVSSDAGTDGAPTVTWQDTPASEQALALFDQGLAQFKAGDYQSSLRNFDAALQQLPNDPVVHEVRALALFALGNYQAAAAALNSFLSSAPGMDWTTMSSLYGSTGDYEAQLRKLEQYCKSNPSDASAFFVLAYHYLAIGSKDAAVNALQVVVKNQPQDYTAKRMLDALAPAQAYPPKDVTMPADVDASGTDLVGNWRATAGNSTIDLTIGEDSQFTWKATQAGKSTAELSGLLVATTDELSLESTDHGAMAGSVKSLGPDKWQFALSGAPRPIPG